MNQSQSIYPLAFRNDAVSEVTAAYLHDDAICKLIEFFESKGLAALKAEDRQELWYADWIAYQTKHQLYARLLSPKKYSALGSQFDLFRLMKFLEVFGYLSPAHGYSLHVSFLGIFPILMSTNEALKKEAIATLERGAVLAFGVSERAHGSDLLANEFTARQISPGRYVADGSKYYIGNASTAAMITILAKKEDESRHGKRAPLLFFALRPGAARASGAFGKVQKINTLGIRAADVAQFEVKGYEFSEMDVICQGRDAWDALFGTIALGRFFLGFGSIGICERALEETAQHTQQRILFGKPVADMPHIQAALAQAYARLTAMKLYAYRALDYVHAASAEDRRYLLFTAVQKARVSVEGVRVIELLAECMGAKGFESDTYFEMARRDIQLIPSLEGSTHINFGLTTQFIESYFSDAAPELADPGSLILFDAPAGENTYLWTASTKNSKDVAFSPFLKAYEPLLGITSVRLFARQARAFGRTARMILARAGAKEDIAANIALGKCFSIVVYAQLVVENAVLCGVSAELTAQIFHGLSEDLALLTRSLRRHDT